MDEATLSVKLPMEVFAGLLFVDVEVGGASRRFLVDTGSPSMMSTALAEELGLDVIDKRKGQDAHGAVVETSIVQADLTLDGTTVHKVPIYVADFPKPPKCLFAGVLGSEVLPLCAWQIDVPSGMLRCSSKLSRLDHIKQAKKEPLHDFGYPHAPILDVRFTSRARSKALFDTGFSEYFAISPPDFDGAKRTGGIRSTTPGTGSIGGSLGGRAPETDQLRMHIESLAIGTVALDDVEALRRTSSPSLIGTSILDHFVVTLDVRNSAAYFSQYREGPFVRPSYGFSLSFEEETQVSLVWEDSPAMAAGLRVGQQVTSINGQPTSTSCDGIRNAMRAMSEGNTVELTWDGGAASLTREKTIPE